jgi:thioredoxin reductase (NADPH)
MTAVHSTRMLILGSGPPGLSAAIYGARAGLAPIVVQGIQPGGQLTITTDVENYPGFRDVIQGPWLMEEMQAQAEHVGAQMMWDTIVDVDLPQRPFTLKGDGGAIYMCDTLVIATGAQAKWLGLESEQKLRGQGRLRLRHLRRLLLSRQEGRGDRRRQHRGRGSALPHQSQP